MFMHTHLDRSWGVLGRILPHLPDLCPSSDITFWSPESQDPGLSRLLVLPDSAFFIVPAQLRKVVGRRGQRWRRKRLFFEGKALRRSPVRHMGRWSCLLRSAILLELALTWTILLDLSSLPARDLQSEPWTEQNRDLPQSAAPFTGGSL